MRTDRIAARYSVYQSSSVAAFIAGHDRARFVVAAKLDAFVAVDLREPRQHVARDAARDEQRLHRVARAEALRLRVVGDAHRLVESAWSSM